VRIEARLGLHDGGEQQAVDAVLIRRLCDDRAVGQRREEAMLRRVAEQLEAAGYERWRADEAMLAEEIEAGGVTARPVRELGEHLERGAARWQGWCHRRRRARGGRPQEH